jgi:hypothetical protein
MSPGSNALTVTPWAPCCSRRSIACNALKRAGTTELRMCWSSGMPGGRSRESSATNGSPSATVRVSKQRLLPGSGMYQRRRCHGVVTLTGGALQAARPRAVVSGSNTGAVDKSAPKEQDHPGYRLEPEPSREAVDCGKRGVVAGVPVHVAGDCNGAVPEGRSLTRFGSNGEASERPFVAEPIGAANCSN